MYMQMDTHKYTCKIIHTFTFLCPHTAMSKSKYTLQYIQYDNVLLCLLYIQRKKEYGKQE